MCNISCFSLFLDAKRLIGTKFDNEAVKNDMLHWPFKVR